MSELKPCPFCGGEIDFDFEHDNFLCSGCFAVMPYRNEESVNTRPIEDALQTEIDRLKKENAELGTDKIHLIQAEMDGGDRWHYTAHDIGYKDLEKKCKALEADYLVSNRELLILQAEIERLQSERRWIPVSERLPNRDGFYLILENVNQVAGYYHWCKQFGWNTDGGRIHIQTVTHWMPLPTPPEDE